MKSTLSLIKELFIQSICKNINCGSQRCDCSDEWIEGCQRYSQFKTDIQSLIKEQTNKK